MRVQIWERADIAGGAVRYLTESPQIHLHYLKTDDEAARDGWSETEICCHGCGVAVIIRFDMPSADVEIPADGDPRLCGEKERFQDRHRSCPMIGGAFLCPLERKSVSVIDLRGKQ